MQTVLYVLLALVAIGALAYAFYQVTVRQQRMLAEITRLERLTAEVTMSAEALLDEIDQRMARLNELAAQMEIRMVADLQAEAQAQVKAQPEDRAVAQEVSGRAHEHERMTQPGSKTEPEPGAEPEPEATPAPQKPKRARRAGAGSRSRAAAGQPSPDSQETQEAPPQDAGDRYGSVRDAVYRLADEGKGVLEIAEALQLPRGEVQLMLNLRGRVPRA